MAKTITMADARREAMRGRLDYKTLQKPQPVEEEQPATQEDGSVLALEKVSEALSSVSGAVASLRESSERQARALVNAIETSGTAKESTGNAQWIFRITKRDGEGNILEFTASKDEK